MIFFISGFINTKKIQIIMVSINFIPKAKDNFLKSYSKERNPSKYNSICSKSLFVSFGFFAAQNIISQRNDFMTHG